MPKTNKLLPYLAWGSTCIAWGTTYLAIKIGVSDTPPFLFAGLRWVTAFILFASFLKLRGYKFPKSSELVPIAIMGISTVGVANGLVSYAEQTIPSGLTALLITTVPFIVVVLEAIQTRGSSFNIYVASGVALGFVGIFLILGDNLSSMLDPLYSLGIVLVFIGVTSWAIGTLYTKKKKINAHPLMKAAFQMLFAGLFQIVIGIIKGELPNFSFSSGSLTAFVYLLIIGSIFGFAFYIYALQHLPASFVSTYAYVNPVIALFVGWLILDESISLQIIAATTIILVGVYLVNIGGNKSSDTKLFNWKKSIQPKNQM